AEDANNTLWFSAGGARSPVVGWLNTKMFLETGDAAKAQGWAPFILDTNGKGKREGDYVEPNQPVDPTKQKRILAGLYGIGIDPNDGTVWGSVLAVPGGVVHVIPGSNPPARHGHRPQRRRVDSACQRPSGELRPQEVQGPAQRPQRHRPPLPGRLDAASVPGTAIRGPRRAGRGRVELLHLGRSVRHFGARAQRADRHRQHVGFAGSAGGRQVRDPAHSLSDGLPRQGARWAHRRSRRRLEGQGALVDL